MKLTIAYITCREDPLIENFYISLEEQIPLLLGYMEKPTLVVVDHFMNERLLPSPRVRLANRLERFIYTAPKPSVWQGPSRLTSVDFFSASNARNTALCYAGNSEYIVYVDDCSMLGKDWVKSLVSTPLDGRVLMGSYEKRTSLLADSSVVGTDYRLNLKPEHHQNVSPRFLAGCTMAIPVKSLLEINGWPEFYCDGMGYEDCITGVVLHNATKCLFTFNPRFKIYEDETAHHVGKKLLRIDPGISPIDKSHTMTSTCSKYVSFPQEFGAGVTSIENLKRRIEARIAWPVPYFPTLEWFTGIPLKDFHLYESRTSQQ